MVIKLEGKIVGASEHIGDSSDSVSKDEAIYFQTLRLYNMGRRVTVNSTNARTNMEYLAALTNYMGEFGLTWEESLDNLYRVKQDTLKRYRDDS